MGAGQYRHRILIEQPVRATEVDGQVVASWTTYAVLWAAVETLEGSESTEIKRLTLSQRWRFLVRASTLAQGITTEMRVLLDGRVLNIASVRTLPDLHDVEILTEASHH